MRIDALHLLNFRRFARVDLELPDGVTALVGRNGAGKSTLLESIGWCLYGNEAARTGKELIKRRGAAPGDDVRVRLAFRFGGHVYEVTRELLGKNESHVATVTVDGKVVVNAGAQSQREATEYVTRLFHMDRIAFFTSLVARQRELAALTDAKPADRKKILISLLRLDAVDEAIALARGRKREARAKLLGLRAGIRDLPPLRAALDATRGMLAADADALAQADAAIVALVESSEEVRARRDDGRKRLAEHQRATFELRSASDRLAHATRERERRVADLARASAAAAQAAALAPQLDALAVVRAQVERLQALRERHQELVRIQQDLDATRIVFSAAEADIAAAAPLVANAATLRSLAARFPGERAKLEEARALATQQLATLDAEVQHARRLFAEVQAKDARIRGMGPESPCPTCTRPLREHHDVLLHDLAAEARAQADAAAKASATADALRKDVLAARAALDALSQREREIQTKLQDAARAEAQLDAARQRLADATARVERLAAQAKAFESDPFDPRALALAQSDARRLEALRDQHAGLAALAGRAPELAALADEGALVETTARDAEAQARAALLALAFDVVAHEQAERAADEAAKRLQDARVRRERAWGDRARRAEDEKRLVAEIEHQESLAAHARALEAQTLVLEKLAADRDLGLLPEFKDHLIGRIRPMLSAHAGRLFRELTDGRYADLELGEDHDLLVHDDGKPFGLARFSGGESDLANLCLRLAVSRVVAERAGTEGFGFLALDEVFGSQDEVRKQNILRSLQALSGSFRQIVLITHVDDVKDAVEHVLRVTEGEDGTSRISVES